MAKQIVPGMLYGPKDKKAPINDRDADDDDLVAKSAESPPKPSADGKKLRTAASCIYPAMKGK